MQAIKGKKLSKSPLSQLTRIGDIQHFEGQMLVLYESKASNNLFLCEWVDRDERNNRWLVYKTNPLVLFQFMQGKIPQRELFRSKHTKGEFWVFDVSSDLKHHNFLKLQKTDLPETYLPQPNAFFEKADCPKFEEIEKLLADLILRESEKRVGFALSDALHSIELLQNQSDLKRTKSTLITNLRNSIEHSFGQLAA